MAVSPVMVFDGVAFVHEGSGQNTRGQCVAILSPTEMIDDADVLYFGTSGVEALGALMLGDFF